MPSSAAAFADTIMNNPTRLTAIRHGIDAASLTAPADWPKGSPFVNPIAFAHGTFRNVYAKNRETGTAKLGNSTVAFRSRMLSKAWGWPRRR
jgi:hypothetical protein